MTCVNRPFFSPFRPLRAVLRLIVVASILASPLQLLPLATVAAQSEPAAPAAPTVITVDTSTDPDNSQSKTCTYTSGVFVAAGDGCTLRRALVEASARPQGDRPIAINFGLASNDPNANLEVAGTWTLIVNNTLPALKTESILNINGQVTIDGATQPGGRSNGPKIIINTNDFSLEVESENNIIRNLAFKGGGAIFLKEDGNTVSDIWMGLSDDGQEIFFRTPGDPFRMAGGGINISANNNIVEDNTISGAFARAVNIDGGDNNAIINNQIGTRADGTVPDVPAASQCVGDLGFDPDSWYGGWGIALSGSNNEVLNNRIAGLHILRSANDTPPMAIEIFGTGHEIANNIIGVDSGGKEVGVCGQGIKVSGSSTQIMDNQIVGSRAGFEDDAQTAIMASDTSPLFGEITVRRNIVKDGPGNVYAFGPGIDIDLRTFNPAKITNINGTSVTGTAGDGSPCPNCLIDLYLDDNDSIGETLSHLGNTTADANGDFNFTLAQALAAGTGIRTSSTAQSSGVIPGFGAGTTTKTSKLFLAMQGVSINGPVTGEIGNAYQFTITVSPAGATTPLDYTIAATDAADQVVNNSQSTVLVGTYTWTQPGVKTITVTVENDLGSVTGTFQIAISDPRKEIAGVNITGPTTGEIGKSYAFSITVSPSDVTVPLDYTVKATDLADQTLNNSQSKSLVATFTWVQPGVKTITVTAENELGSVSETFQITVTDPASGEALLHMPLLAK